MATPEFNYLHEFNVQTGGWQVEAKFFFRENFENDVEKLIKLIFYKKLNHWKSSIILWKFIPFTPEFPVKFDDDLPQLLSFAPFTSHAVVDGANSKWY